MSHKSYEQGHFYPENKDKYKGTLPIIYRSSYELALMRWLDRLAGCISWGSESEVVPYVDKNKTDAHGSPTVHRYFIDFTALFKNKDGSVKKFYIEIKPFKHTLKPKKTPKKKDKTFITECIEYERNIAKWTAAREWAKKRNAEFIILTEKELFSDKR